MLIWIWRSRAQYSRGTPVAARRRSWRAGAHRVAPLILVVLALGAGALSAQVRPHARAGFATDGLRWPGNTVLGRSRPKQLMVVQEPGPAGPYRVALLTSQDDGRSWQPQAVVTDVEADDFYDPALVQAPDSSLLTCAHSNGELRFFRSQDEGRTWARHATVLPPEGSAYAECYPRALTGSSLLVAYGAFERAAGVTRYEARVSRDSGRTWGEPTLLGSGGRIRDAMRPGVSSQARDGSLLVVFAYRDSADGPVSVLGRRVEGAGVAAAP
jgi:hypothetical protein